MIEDPPLASVFLENQTLVSHSGTEVDYHVVTDIIVFETTTPPT